MSLFAMISAAAAVAAPTPEKPRDCKPAGPEMAAAASRAGFHKLGELPPANHVLTLFRTVDSCSAPVIVRYGIGGSDAANR